VNLDPAAENFDYPVAMGKQEVLRGFFFCDFRFLVSYGSLLFGV
jgi:hypothetical protein